MQKEKPKENIYFSFKQFQAKDKEWILNICLN